MVYKFELNYLRFQPRLMTYNVGQEVLYHALFRIFHKRCEKSSDISLTNHFALLRKRLEKVHQIVPVISDDSRYTGLSSHKGRTACFETDGLHQSLCPVGSSLRPVIPIPQEKVLHHKKTFRKMNRGQVRCKFTGIRIFWRLVCLFLLKKIWMCLQRR